MVIEELAAQHARRYQKAHEQVERAMEALRRATPWQLPNALGDSDPKRVREHWREQYGVVAETIPTSETALREGLFREANGLPPSRVIEKGKDKEEKTGGRDAAIWLSAVEYARENLDETVYFVSQNTKDLGDGSSYSPPMDSDVRGLDGRFIHLDNLDDVVSRFAQATASDEELLRKRLSAPANEQAVAIAAVTNNGEDLWDGAVVSGTVLDEDLPAPETVRGTWVLAPVVQVGSLNDVQSYQIGTHEWCTASVRWVCSGIITSTLYGLLRVASAWEVRVLLTPSKEDTKLTILRTISRQSPISESDRALVLSPDSEEWPTQERLKLVLPLRRRNTQELRNLLAHVPSDMEEQLLDLLMERQLKKPWGRE